MWGGQAVSTGSPRWRMWELGLAPGHVAAKSMFFNHEDLGVLVRFEGRQTAPRAPTVTLGCSVSRVAA